MKASLSDAKQVLMYFSRDELLRLLEGNELQHGQLCHNYEKYYFVFRCSDKDAAGEREDD